MTSMLGGKDLGMWSDSSMSGPYSRVTGGIVAAGAVMCQLQRLVEAKLVL